MSNHETEQAVAAFFHLNRSLGKRKDTGSDSILKAFIKRARYEEAERRFYAKLDEWDWERQWG